MEWEGETVCLRMTVTFNNDQGQALIGINGQTYHDEYVHLRFEGPNRISNMVVSSLTRFDG